MKLTRGLLALSINFALILPAVFFSFAPATAAQSAGDAALQRGYRTGYSDGYMAGYRDMLDGQDKAVERHSEYDAADRAYNKEYGALEDYRDGYRQGFRAGYDTGFDKKSFESVVPAGLARRGVEPVVIPKDQTAAVVTAPVNTAVIVPEETKVADPQPIAPQTSDPQPVVPQVDSASPSNTTDTPAVVAKSTYRDDGNIMSIPKDTEIVLVLQDDIGTQLTRPGERFTAKVIAPMELDGAVVEGHVEKVQIPGRLKKPAEIQLSFDRIVLSDTRWSNFNGVLTEVIPIKGDNVKRISNEGTAVGQSSIKGDAIKIGASTGAGAGIGAIAGGPVGLAIGASVGAAFGVGSALIDRGKHIRLNKNQQLKVRSSYDTQIR
ncbi:MAG: hypothetical protein ACJ72Z_12930 [Pyrinomonadaceae bacterium]